MESTLEEKTWASTKSHENGGHWRKNKEYNQTHIYLEMKSRLCSADLQSTNEQAQLSF